MHIFQNVQAARKGRKRAAHINYSESRWQAESVSSAQNVTYIASVTFTLELRSIPEC
jgi:hypothetical protein